LSEAADIGDPDREPRPVAVTVVTTEHFTLQGARAATISESTGRATMFLSSVSGGLVALGLVATAAGAALYAFALVLLPTLTFVGLVTFERALQSGIEDYAYARRIARLRGYYFDAAPELTPYLLSVAAPDRLSVQGLWTQPVQKFLTVAGMVAVITGVLAGSAVGVLVAAASDGFLAAALPAGAATGLATLTALMLVQRAAWQRAGSVRIFQDDPHPPKGR
jgi:hypothetical protein